MASANKKRQRNRKPGPDRKTKKDRKGRHVDNHPANHKDMVRPQVNTHPISMRRY